MTTTVEALSQLEQLRRLQRLKEVLRYHWYCGIPGCDGRPGHRLPNGVMHIFPHARAQQCPPEGDWRAWFMCTGRGMGKTRSAAEWVKDRMLAEPNHRVAIIAPDLAVGKNVCLEGESGLVGPTGKTGVMPPERIRTYNKTTGELTLTNGSMVQLFGTNTQMDAERVRGYQFATMWFEEIATQRYGEVAWDISQFSLRLGHDPRIVITSTPRRTPLVKRLLNTEPGIVVTRGRTLDNADNLPESTVEYLRQRYEGTTLGRQELEGELLEMMPGALWTMDMLDEDRNPAPEDMERVVVAIDPAGSHRTDSDETGIVVVGKKGDHYYVLADVSGTYTPEKWAWFAVKAYREFKADRIVAEGNYGGDMVEATLRARDKSVAYRKVTATRGKLLRAEPILALYERHLVHHPSIGFPTLEEQMVSWVPPGQFETDEKTGESIALAPSNWSPDRVDALVWALTDLSQKQVRYSHG